MNRKTIEMLYDYNRWANARALEAASALPQEDFTRDLGNSFRSVRDTLAHILAAEWIWLERWKGTSPTGLPDGAEFPSVDALKSRWADIERGQQEFIDSLPDQLEQVIHYANTKGQKFAWPLWKLMLHVVNHSTYHRGQVTTLLRQLGAKPLSTDLTAFYDAKQ